MSSGLDVIIGQSIVAAIGLFILWRLWHEAKRRQIEQNMEAPVFVLPTPMDVPTSTPVSNSVHLLQE